MAFLDNSGDIILDAVLTDAGRKRMAEGSFEIAKYAFGDDEINYELYDASDARGVDYYDIEIMQTPILEAFTNNRSSMGSFLMSLEDQRRLNMPILRLNQRWGRVHDLDQHEMFPRGKRVVSHTSMVTGSFLSGEPVPGAEGADPDSTVAASMVPNLHRGTFVVTCNAATEELFKFSVPDGQGGDGQRGSFSPSGQGASRAAGAMIPPGVILGSNINYRNPANKNYICIDQGIDGAGSVGLTIDSAFPQEALETGFLIEIDNRFGEITTARHFNQRRYSVEDVGSETAAPWEFADKNRAEPSILSKAFVDDDHVATYVVTAAGAMNGMITRNIRNTIANGNIRDSLNEEYNDAWFHSQVFVNGPLGSRLQFSIKASQLLESSDQLFIQQGARVKYLGRHIGSPAPFQVLASGDPFVADITGGDSDSGADDGNLGDGESTIGLGIHVYYLDTMVRVTGINTGQTIDIPVRFVRKKTA